MGNQNQDQGELGADSEFSPAPQLPQHPVDRYVLEYWSVLSNSIARSVATYYANATAAEVWPDDEFYKNAPPFVDSWLVEGWERGRVLGWANVMPDPGTNRVYWSETGALKRLILDLEKEAKRYRERAEQTEGIIVTSRATLALAESQATSAGPGVNNLTLDLSSVLTD